MGYIGFRVQGQVGSPATFAEAKIAPNAISYTAAMGACEKGGQWQMALAAWLD